ncbi:MAG: hypothetical protein P0S93_02645, partial [Candidatus Neptunochlamydia sp.]|nr:hypothetical protein [Candidatus Neptunochlamydia sp.]
MSIPTISGTSFLPDIPPLKPPENDPVLNIVQEAITLWKGPLYDKFLTMFHAVIENGYSKETIFDALNIENVENIDHGFDYDAYKKILLKDGTSITQCYAHLDIFFNRTVILINRYGDSPADFVSHVKRVLNIFKMVVTSDKNLISVIESYRALYLSMLVSLEDINYRKDPQLIGLNLNSLSSYGIAILLSVFFKNSETGRLPIQDLKINKAEKSGFKRTVRDETWLEYNESDFLNINRNDWARFETRFTESGESIEYVRELQILNSKSNIRYHDRGEYGDVLGSIFSIVGTSNFLWDSDIYGIRETISLRDLNLMDEGEKLLMYQKNKLQCLEKCIAFLRKSFPFFIISFKSHVNPAKFGRDLIAILKKIEEIKSRLPRLKNTVNLSVQRLSLLNKNIRALVDLAGDDNETTNKILGVVSKKLKSKQSYEYYENLLIQMVNTKNKFKNDLFNTILSYQNGIEKIKEYNEEFTKLFMKMAENSLNEDISKMNLAKAFSAMYFILFNEEIDKAFQFHRKVKESKTILFRPPEKDPPVIEDLDEYIIQKFSSLKRRAPSKFARTDVVPDKKTIDFFRENIKMDDLDTIESFLKTVMDNNQLSQMKKLQDIVERFSILFLSDTLIKFNMKDDLIFKAVCRLSPIGFPLSNVTHRHRVLTNVNNILLKEISPGRGIKLIYEDLLYQNIPGYSTKNIELAARNIVNSLERHLLSISRDTISGMIKETLNKSHLSNLTQDEQFDMLKKLSLVKKDSEGKDTKSQERIIGALKNIEESLFQKSVSYTHL